MSTDNQENYIKLELTPDPANPNRLYTYDDLHKVAQWAANEGYKAGWKNAMAYIQPNVDRVIDSLEKTFQAYHTVFDTLKGGY